ncbi:unnamed protein product [Blumeria hordei]|uniref:AB hydrolase-1 domain-containing protein n=1 Tax=Blumeria hordei TaxID=2867405 RepID=A0A383V0T1_BLUHO|nr:unnamed protein product [Blumeria hordei]
MEKNQQWPSVEEITAHPSFPDAIWKLTPSQKGSHAVAAGRGGPFNIDWEVHGSGDIKLVWVMGLGSVKSSWQRQTLRFGHDEHNRYSSLVFDNRGMGKSDKPLMRYSTSEMAKDVIELLDHLGWNEKRQLHVSGVSMGGMIAQEIAYLIPDRISSLNLLSTAAYIENTTTFVENMQTRIRMLIPKSLDRSVREASQSLFPDTWLAAPDNTAVPTATSPMVVFPPSGKYGSFSTNYERFSAAEITKRSDIESFGRTGFILQLIAAGWHHKSPEQLKEIGDKVGRERIMVMHGTADKMISVHHGRKLIEFLQPGTGIIKEGTGHVFMVEECEYHNKMIEEMFQKGESSK